MKKSSEQQKIDRELSKIKKELLRTRPMCIFCLQRVGENCDLAHKIRRSETSNIFTKFELQTHKMNVGLAHRNCHDTFDDDPELAKSLPGYKAVMNDIKQLDPNIYLKMINR